MDDHKHAYDAVSLAIVGGTFVGWLPSIAAALSIVWTLIRICESRMAQRAAVRLRVWFSGDKH